MTTVATLDVQIGANISGLSRGLDQADRGIQGFGKRASDAIGGVGRKLTGLGAATAPLTIALGGGIKVASNFEGAMTEISARTGIVGKDLQALSDFALQMGADTVFSGQQAADALLQILTSGSSATEAMALLPLVLDAAAASGEDLGKTADTITDIIAAFQLDPIDEAGQVVDALSQAAGASSATMADLGAGFANVGGVANAFGMGVEDTAATLAIFSENGIKGAEAGTQLRSMLLNLSSTTPKTTKAWAELGTSLYDAEGNARPLEDVISDLDTALDKLPMEDQNRLMKQLGGSYGIMGLNALRGSVSIEEMRDKMRASAKASDVADAKMATFAMTMDSLAGSVEALMITGLTPLMNDVLKPLAQNVIVVVNEITDWTRANPYLASTIARVAFAVSAAGTAAIALGGALMVAAPIVAAFGAGLGLLLSPLGLAVAGLAVFGPQIAGLASTIGEALGSIQIGDTTIGAISASIGNAISSAFSGVVVDVSSLGDLPGKIIAAMEAALGGNAGAKEVVTDSLSEGFGPGMGAAVVSTIQPDVFTPLAAEIKRLIEEAFAGVVIDFSGLVANIETAITGAVGDVSIDTSGATAIKDKIEAAINGITIDTSAISTLPTTIQGAISGAMDSVVIDTSGVTAVVDEIEAAISGGFTGELDLTGVDAWANTNMNAILDTVVTVAGIVLGGPIGLAIGAAKLVSSAIESDFLGIGTLLSESGIGGAIESAFNNLKATIDGIIASIFGGGEPAFEVGPANFDFTGMESGSGVGVLGKFGADLAKGVEVIKGIVESVGPGITEGIEAMGAGIGRFVSGIMGAETEGLYDAIRPVLAVIGGIASGALTLAGLGIGTILETIGNVLGPFGEGIGSLITAVSRLGEGDIGGALGALGDGIKKFGDAALAIPATIANNVLSAIEGLLGVELPNFPATVDEWASAIGDAFRGVGIIFDNIKRGLDLFFLDVQMRITGKIGELRQTILDMTEGSIVGAIDIAPAVNEANVGAQSAIAGMKYADALTAALNAQLATGDGIDLGQAITVDTGTGFAKVNTALTGFLSDPTVIAGMGEAGKLAIEQALAVAFETANTSAIDTLVPAAIELGIDTAALQTQVTQDVAAAAASATPSASVDVQVSAVVTNLSEIATSVMAQVQAAIAGSSVGQALTKVGQAIQTAITPAPGGSMPAYDTGIGYVPTTQAAILHRGEAVLTAGENRERRRGGSTSGGDTININNPMGNGYALADQIDRARRNRRRGR